MRDWLESKRKRKKMTQEQVAELSQVARTTYAMIEQGKRDPSVKVAKNIAKTLNFNWAIFFDDKLHDSCIKGVEEISS